MIRRFFRYTSQNISAMIGLSLYILADTFFISKYAGADGLATLSLFLPAFGILYGVGLMLGNGFATVYTIGKASGEDVSTHFMQALLWALVLGFPIAILGYLFPSSIMRLLGGQQSHIALGSGYVRILMSMTPVFFLNFICGSFARNDNAPTFAMVASLVGSFSNILFDYLFLFVFDWGFQSAATATVISPCLSILILSFHFLGKRGGVGLKIGRPSLKVFFRSCALGMSSFMAEISSGITIFVFNNLIMGLSGSIGVAAYSITANIAYVPGALYGGIADGSQPLLSESYGKDDRKSLHLCLKLGLVSILIAAILVVSCCWLFTGPIVNVFNGEQDAELARTAFTSVRLYSLGFLVSGINMMLISFYAATDKPKPEIIGSFSRGCVSIVICALVMSRIWGLIGIWLSFLCAEVLTLIILLAISKRRFFR